jgi:hypothetical protein
VERVELPKRREVVADGPPLGNAAIDKPVANV